MDFIQSWGAWRAGKSPHLLVADREAVLNESRSRLLEPSLTWRRAILQPAFGQVADKRLHLGLIPQPFVGDLRRASVYVLLLNPGLSASDYYGEYQVPAYRRALLANLRQGLGKTEAPFLFLDPRFSWHSGFSWWHDKLAGVILELARRWDVDFGEARRRLSRQIASIELIPYHSRGLKVGRWMCGLPSVHLALEFVHSVVVRRVRSGRAIVIVLRQAAVWDLPRLRGGTVYSSAEARGAHLSPNSPGGKAMLRHLTRRNR